MVAGLAELLPELVAQLVGHLSDGLPLLLELDQLVGRLAPLRAVHQLLGLGDELALLVGILRILRAALLVVGVLASEEVVAGGAEAVENLLVDLRGGKADLLPFLLHVEDLLRMAFPVGVGLVFLLHDGLHLLAEGRLLLQVVVLA